MLLRKNAFEMGNCPHYAHKMHNHSMQVSALPEPT